MHNAFTCASVWRTDTRTHIEGIALDLHSRIVYAYIMQRNMSDANDDVVVDDATAEINVTTISQKVLVLVGGFCAQVFTCTFIIHVAWWVGLS